MKIVDMSSFEGHAKQVSYIDEQDVTVYRHGNGYGKVNSFLNISYFDARRIGIFLDSSRNLSYHETFQEFMTGNNMLLSAAVNASRLSIVENTCIDEKMKSALHELHKHPPRVDVTSLVLGDDQLTSQTIAYVPRQSAFNKSLPPASFVVLGHSSNDYISGHLFGHIADDANYSHAMESSVSRSNFVEQYLNLSCAAQGVLPLHCVPRLLNSTQICKKPYNDTLINLTLTYGCATSIIVKVYESNNVNMSFAMAENIYRFYNPGEKRK